MKLSFIFFSFETDNGSCCILIASFYFTHLICFFSLRLELGYDRFKFFIIFKIIWIFIFFQDIFRWEMVSVSSLYSDPFAFQMNKTNNPKKFSSVHSNESCLHIGLICNHAVSYFTADCFFLIAFLYFIFSSKKQLFQ